MTLLSRLMVPSPSNSSSILTWHVTFVKPQVNSIGHEKEKLLNGGKMKGS